MGGEGGGKTTNPVFVTGCVIILQFLLSMWYYLVYFCMKYVPTKKFLSLCYYNFGLLSVFLINKYWRVYWFSYVSITINYTSKIVRWWRDAEYENTMSRAYYILLCILMIINHYNIMQTPPAARTVLHHRKRITTIRKWNQRARSDWIHRDESTACNIAHYTRVPRRPGYNYLYSRFNTPKHTQPRR